MFITNGIKGLLQVQRNCIYWMSYLMIDRRMKCEYTVVKALFLLVTILGSIKGDFSEYKQSLWDMDLNSNSECYRAEFSEDVWSCPDFDNTVMKCDPLELGMLEDGGLGLQGMITVEEVIENGTMMSVEVWKIIDVGKEYLYHAQGDICGSLKDDNTPWFPLVDAMKIKDCPIDVKSYDVKDMVLNLEAAKDMLTHSMCGDYLVQMSMTKKLNKLACYELGISISEYTCD